MQTSCKCAKFANIGTKADRMRVILEKKGPFKASALRWIISPVLWTWIFGLDQLLCAMPVLFYSLQ